jgi:hypothetical protein
MIREVWRWYINRIRRPIGNGAGDVFFWRYRILKTPILGVYLHVFERSDKDRCLHDHAWPFISVILRAGYFEEMKAEAYDPSPPATTFHWRKPGTILFRRPSTAHRIVIEDGTRPVSLVIVGPKWRDWGFWTRDGWRKAVEGQKSPECGEAEAPAFDVPEGLGIEDLPTAGWPRLCTPPTLADIKPPEGWPTPEMPPEVALELAEAVEQDNARRLRIAADLRARWRARDEAGWDGPRDIEEAEVLEAMADGVLPDIESSGDEVPTRPADGELSRAVAEAILGQQTGRVVVGYTTGGFSGDGSIPAGPIYEDRSDIVPGVVQSRIVPSAAAPPAKVDPEDTGEHIVNPTGLMPSGGWPTRGPMPRP